MLSVRAIRSEDRFHVSKKGGIGRGGRVSARGAVHMAAALAGCQHGVPCTWQLPWLAVENPGRQLAWAFPSFLTQMGVDKAPLPFRGSISGTVGSFQLGEALRPLTIICKLANEWAWQRS